MSFRDYHVDVLKGSVYTKHRYEPEAVMAAVFSDGIPLAEDCHSLSALMIC